MSTESKQAFRPRIHDFQITVTVVHLVGNAEVISLHLHRKAGSTFPAAAPKTSSHDTPRGVLVSYCAEQFAVGGRYTATVTEVSVRVTAR